MKCDICSKNEATIHIQEIMNGKKKNLNICPQCASEKNLTENDIEGFNLSEILYNLSSQMLNSAENNNEQQKIPLPSLDPAAQPAITCSKCGWNTAKFHETGRLGCARCYAAFESILKNALKNMHKGNVHLGKHPSNVVGTNAELAIKLLALQNELEQHVQKEEYEKAAKLRDRINNLKKNCKTPKKKKRVQK